MNVIVAVDENWAIGYKNNLLCRISEDLKRFKKLTINNIVVMGRKTFESFPKGALPKRENVVLSRKPYEAENITNINSIDELLKYLEGKENVFIIGGGELYKELLPYSDRVYVTKIKKTFEADTYYPNLDENKDFRLVHESPSHFQDDVEFVYCDYKRI